jgi:phosphate transport system ATP-binding protein
MTIGAGVKLSINNLDIVFDHTHALKHVTMDIHAHQILTVIGPANSGKTTFLRACNRLNELNPALKETGEILFEGKDIKKIDIEELRRKIGMVFALPLPLPLSIFDNVAYGIRMLGLRNKNRLAASVEKALQQAYIWDEVKDRLNESAFTLSGGQQQRLCIARTLAVEPEAVLFDEPCSGLDPISTAKVEEAMIKLKKEYTMILVTNNVKQAARVGDKTAFFLMGELIELDNTDKMFTAPRDRRTDDYISGKFG